MTDEQINATIHEVLGRPLGCPECSDPECAYNEGLNYCADLNAMHEAEKTLDEDQMWRMARNIELNPDRWYFHASARDRAEAFLRTVGKWEEAK